MQPISRNTGAGCEELAGREAQLTCHVSQLPADAPELRLALLVFPQRLVLGRWHAHHHAHHEGLHLNQKIPFNQGLDTEGRLLSQQFSFGKI